MSINKTDAVKELMESKPNMTAPQIAKKLNIKIGYVYTLMSKIRNSKSKIKPISVADFIHSVTQGRGTVDNVNHPPHYKVGGIETIDFIEAKGLDYHLGNVIKYISRSDHKDNKLENLKKAQWYLNRAVDNLTK